MRSGTVSWFDLKRGVGGIVEDGSGRQLAVHAAAIDGGGSQSLRPQDRVRFTVTEGGGGARAVHVWSP